MPQAIPLLLFLAGTALAHAGEAANPCTAAIAQAERQHGLPPGLLPAIAKVESGRPDPAQGRVEPWPWTVQSEGQGRYFQTKAEAVRWVLEAQARGLASVDVGCMQVNLQFHPKAFASVEQAFDPATNVGYAARFLLSLYAEAGDWRVATGFYHSRTSDRADAYRARVGRASPGSAAAVAARQAAPQPSPVAATLAAAWRATLPAPQPAAPAGPEAASQGRPSRLRLAWAQAPVQ